MILKAAVRFKESLATTNGLMNTNPGVLKDHPWDEITAVELTSSEFVFIRVYSWFRQDDL
jgi:hypothetical protein